MNFEKESKSEKKKKTWVEVGRGGGGNTETKTVSQTVKRGKIQNSNHLHNVKHVVQLKFTRGHNSVSPVVSSVTGQKITESLLV